MKNSTFYRALSCPECPPAAIVLAFVLLPVGLFFVGLWAEAIILLAPMTIWYSIVLMDGE
ncbi:hypothetical protein [Falsiphaeobacter marinintestinus]|uniref:hypothetical protein n=1 Tax=Falsiphaeobacter marinintestinus TaxID=1492905 RepID=UPI0011B5A7EC|nr:hypothetical protein [Phaeobacter marinintestinus]